MCARQWSRTIVMPQRASFLEYSHERRGKVVTKNEEISTLNNLNIDLFVSLLSRNKVFVHEFSERVHGVNDLANYLIFTNKQATL